MADNNPKNTSPAPAETFQPAIGDWRSHLRFWLVAVVLLVLDLWSKSWVFSTLEATEVRTFIPGVVEMRRSLNDGAVFGSFSGYVGLFILASLFALGFVFYLFATSWRRHWLLHISLAMVLAGAIGNLHDRAFVQADVIRAVENGRKVTLMIGEIVSEPDADPIRIGDWPDKEQVRRFDRDKVIVSRQGVVRDFIKFVPVFPEWVPKLGGKDVWPWIFNIADASLVCGVILLLLTSWVERRHPPR